MQDRSGAVDAVQEFILYECCGQDWKFLDTLDEEKGAMVGILLRACLEPDIEQWSDRYKHPFPDLRNPLSGISGKALARQYAKTYDKIAIVTLKTRLKFSESDGLIRLVTDTVQRWTCESDPGFLLLVMVS